jgi:hypothetical protein
MEWVYLGTCAEEIRIGRETNSNVVMAGKKIDLKAPNDDVTINSKTIQLG